MTMILRNIDRMSKTETKKITDQARKLRKVLGVGPVEGIQEGESP